MKSSDPSGNKTDAVVISLKEEEIPEDPPAGPPIFGETLADGLARSQAKNPGYLVPDVLYEACRYLEGNGIHSANCFLTTSKVCPN